MASERNWKTIREALIYKKVSASGQKTTSRKINHTPACPAHVKDRLYRCMIKSFVDKETEKVYNQIFSKKLPQTIQRIALRKLMMIDNARCLEDLRVPPANHLELLHGDREGQYSIRINIQYRICFNVDGNDFFNVEIVDYHS